MLINQYDIVLVNYYPNQCQYQQIRLILQLLAVLLKHIPFTSSQRSNNKEQYQERHMY